MRTVTYPYSRRTNPTKIQPPLRPVVFNTEAHPFIAPAAKAVYGSPQSILKPTGTFQLKQGPPLPAISPNAKLPTPIPVPPLQL